MSERARRFRVTGRVQGVGFRWWTTRQAERLGLRGTVRNCRDGSVEIYAAGPESAVSELESALSSGPRSAHVEAVESDEVEPEAVEDGFRVIR